MKTNNNQNNKQSNFNWYTVIGLFFILYSPILLIWVINTLFLTINPIPYTFKTWFAMGVILGYIMFFKTVTPFVKYDKNS